MGPWIPNGIVTISKAVLPVAGMGTRLLPATKSQPKEMLPVGTKPVVQHVVEELVEEGVDKLLFVTGRKKRSIEDHFDDDPELDSLLREKGESVAQLDYEKEGVEFFYVRQRRPLGNADAIRLGARFVGEEPFLVGFGDTIIRSPHKPGVVGRMITAHLRNEAAATIAVWEVSPDEVQRYGIVRPGTGTAGDGDCFPISGIVEKPRSEHAPSRLAVAARYIFDRRVFEAIDKIVTGHGGELWLTDAIQILIDEGHGVQCVPLLPDERRYDIGSPTTYYRAFADFALADPNHGPVLADYLRARLLPRAGEVEP